MLFCECYVLMCDGITRVLRESLVETEENQVEMDGLVPSSNEDSHNPRLKFLCSFNGNILPRPQDGKLRYVGGETRIVSVPRNIGFEELMMKMKELFEGVSVLKYQQPDEELDALVSVVNDDDVINMMDEYDKLGSGDAFTRLRIFLFSNPELDDSVHFDVDERDHEKRYVDALNSLNDSPEFGKQPGNEILMAPAEDFPATERYFSHLNIDGSFGTHRNFESSWNPAYYSSRHPANDFPASPSYSPYPEDYQQVNHMPPENMLLLPPAPISGNKTGFPANLLQSPVIFDGNNVCEPRSYNHLNGLHSVVNPCAECPPNDPRSFYNDAHAREPRSYNNPGARRLSDHYIVDNNGMNLAYPDDHHLASHYGHSEERGGRYGNFPYGYGPENHYHASSHGNTFWRNVQSPVHGSSSYEASGVPQQENDTYNLRSIRTRMDSNPSSRVRVDNQNPGFDYSVMPNSYNLENQHHLPPEPVQFTNPHLQNDSNLVVESDLVPSFLDDKVLSFKNLNTEARNGGSGIEMARKVEEKEGPSVFSFSGREQKNTSSLQLNEGISSNCLPAMKIIRAQSSHEDNASNSLKKDESEVKCLSYVPKYIESIKKSALEDKKEVKGEPQENAVNDAKAGEETAHELDAVDATADLEVDSDGETESNLKIEQTKAEEEAIAKGLQTIKNDDLEEIRELGSGTYGAVYHGKWKGSDVAIKRIKASCFAGKPSERERLIAEFWREALILSSLHHPNVVAFYGIVRDGPDGSLATVTEFMVNGSLKQFLKKKDRTIDRRKRLIIAMDASFGMEYLHGKNIVHFDLKCENLLVNMRDPHRPICKIGDLGLSKVKQHTLVSGGVRGTLPWMAPELLSGKSHMVTEKIDVYSFGIVMWELLTGDEPYGDMHCASIIGGIVNNSLRPTIPTWCDPEWKSLMGNCWSAEPAQRPSFSEISHKLRTMAAAINVK